MDVRTFGFRPQLVATVAVGAVLLLVSTHALAGEGTFSGPTPYLSSANSPFVAGINAGTVFLETFECGVQIVPGVTPSAGSVLGPGGLTDSVDADDGAIDGSGLGGNSFFSGNGAAGITFTFNSATLGALPTQAGIVWTDGGGTTTFEAFDAMGASLGTIGPVSIADGSNSGTTGEDRFFGVVFAGGISAIRISNSSGGIEVDHLQYGLYTGTARFCGGATPTPTVAAATPTATPTSVPPTATPTSVAPTATLTPISVAGPAVPTLSFPMLALLALGLAGAAILLIRGT